MSTMVQLGSSAAGRRSPSSSSSSSSSASSSVAAAMLQQLSASSSLDNVHSTVQAPAVPLHHPGPSIGLTTLHLASQALEMMPDSSGADADVDAPMPSDLPLKSPTRLTSPGYSPRGSHLYHCAASRTMHSPPASRGTALHFNGNSNYFGLPYQDHNYGAPPPITPPATPSPSSQQQQQQTVKVNGHLSHIDIEHVSCHTTVSTTSSPPSSREPHPQQQQQQHPPHHQSPAHGPPTPAQHTQQGSSDSDVTVDPGIDTGITRCICDFEHDDGYMICCDRCGVWQHVDCMGLDRNSIPESYFCELCEPRQLDKHRAVVIQTKKREFLKTLAVDSSATETEDETPHGKTKKKNKAGRKKRQERSMLALSKQPSELYSGSNNALKMLKQRTKKRHLQQQAKMAAASGGLSPQKKKFMVHSSPAKKVLGNRRSRQHSSPMYTGDVMSPEGPLTPPPSSSNNQSWLDGSSSPEHMQADTYEEAKYNQYSIDVETLLTTGRFNGQHSTLKHDAMLQDQRCRVTQVTPSRKGLVATEDLECGEPLIEFKGKVMLREQYDKENLFFTSLHPFVLFYSKFDGFDLCIDASAYGSDARCVRRSCSPNSEVRHFIQGADIHFFIYSTEAVNCADEVTIPFDFHYQRCSYGVECACCKPNCPVVKSHQQRKDSITVESKRKKKPRKLSVRLTDSSAPEKPAKRRWSESGSALAGRRRVSKSRDDHLSSDNEDMSPVKAKPIKVATSPKSPKSPGPRAKRRRLSPLRVSHANNKPELRNGGRRDSVHEPKPEPPESTPMSPESPACNAQSNSEADKKMTREEKKMEAIMKAFERMEKREERRKEAISRIHPKDEPSPTPARIKERKDSSKSSRDSRDTQDVTVKVEPKRGPRLGRRKGRARSECEADLKEESEEEELVKEEVKEEVEEEEEMLPKGRKVGKKGKRKCRAGPPSRRQSRASSSIAADSSDDGITQPSLSLPSTAASTPLPSSEPSTASSMDKQFKFPKTKRLLMTEWFNEKQQLSIKTEEQQEEPPAPDPPVVEEASADFVRCLPSPHSNSLSHLRRNSMSSAPVKPVTPQVDSCFTKKRWLRQAMTEHKPCTSTSSAREAEASPSDSPRAASPIDFVTPLKKRRLARESLGAASSTEMLLSPVVSSDGMSDSTRPPGQASPASSVEPINGLLTSSVEQSMVVECSSNNDSSPNTNTCRELDLSIQDEQEPMSSQGFSVSHLVDSSSSAAAATCDSGGELVQSSSSPPQDDVHSTRRTTSGGSDVCDSTALPLATSSSSVVSSPPRGPPESSGVSEGVGDTVSCSTDIMQAPCSEKEDGEITSDEDEVDDVAADSAVTQQQQQLSPAAAVPSSSCEEISTSTDTPLPRPPSLDFPITGGRLSTEDACVGSSSSDLVSSDDRPSSSDHTQTVDSSQQQQQNQQSEAASSSCRKKVSLLEYRKRVKSVGSKDTASTSTTRRMSSPAPSVAMVIPPREVIRPSLAPLPIFSGILSPALPPPPQQPCQPDGKKGEETDVRWDASATSAERMREQTHLSLTERLRKEFGLDTSETEDEAAAEAGGAYEDVPPPPPPPPPALSPVALPVTLPPPRPPAYPTPPQPPAFMTGALLTPAPPPLLSTVPPPPMPPPMPPAPPILSSVVIAEQMSNGGGAASSSIPSLLSLPPMQPTRPFKRHVYEDASSSSSTSASSSSSSRPPPVPRAMANGDGLQAGEISSTAGGSEYTAFTTPCTSSSSYK